MSPTAFVVPTLPENAAAVVATTAAAAAAAAAFAVLTRHLLMCTPGPTPSRMHASIMTASSPDYGAVHHAVVANNLRLADDDSDQVIAAVNGNGAAMDRAVELAVSAKDSATLLALSTAARDEDGSTCLHRLLGFHYRGRNIIPHCQNHQLLWDALRCGANSEAQDKMGHSPLHTAAHHGHSQAAHVLAAAGADVNLRDKNGDTPLHLSAELGDPWTMQILLQAGADRELKDEDGFRAIQIARRVNMDCFRMLLGKDVGGTLQPPGWCTV